MTKPEIGSIEPMLIMELHHDSLIPLDAVDLTADRLQQLDLKSIERLPIYHGNLRACLGDFFKLRGDPSDGAIEMEGDYRRVKNIGSMMRSGFLRIHSSVGMHLGAGLMGGKITVNGDVSDWCGAEMVSGEILVRGNTGDTLGGAYLGSLEGMRGGRIHVEGNAGDEVGSNMRRGWITIQGNAGDYLGISMIAGSIWVRQKMGLHVGAGMKRGTIIGSECEKLPPSFRFDCQEIPIFLKLYIKHLKDNGENGFRDWENRLFSRYRGDFLAMGKGEIWQLSF